MTKHYILNLDPNAKYDWDRRTLRDPITADHPALADLIAQEVGEDPGSYLIAVSIEVKVLEKVANEQVKQTAAPVVSSRPQLPQRAELVA
ncbi:MAG: hypothetical protein KME27_22275 [Lyngbya sp. HA4199-MV5]|jgi:hypothetical protein|nr:hypothetical protein [Lyngbya sp. HA4199-MV5]